jgi:hypothetical protein
MRLHTAGLARTLSFVNDQWAEVDFSALEAELADPLAGASLPLDDFSLFKIREAFALTSMRWHELCDPSTLSADADFVFQMMTSKVGEDPGDGARFEDYDPRLSAVMSAGLGGYAWRAAEQSVGRTSGPEIADGIREAIVSIAGDDSFSQVGASREQAALYRSSANAITIRVPLWDTSPGHRAWGGALFRAGKRYATVQLASTTEPLAHPADLSYAFMFGVALRHVEQQLAGETAPIPGELVGPEWETCEIELDTVGPLFVAISGDGDRRRVVARSERLPTGRFPLPGQQGRNAVKSMRRHEKLVEALARDGWERMAAQGHDWWSHRFRRRRKS